MPTSGIYCIEHIASGKRYVGKSINIEARLWAHAWALQQVPRKKDCNRHLWNAVQKYGWSSFRTCVLEEISSTDHDAISDREIFWMDHLGTCDRNSGYNLRRDSSTSTEVHAETRKLMAESVTGEANPNFGNRWDEDQKSRMSEDAKARHAAGRYGEEWRRKLGVSSSLIWADMDKRRAMAEKVALAMLRYRYEQIDPETGAVIRVWDTVKEICAAHPEFRSPNIYGCCHGHKKTHRGFTWRQIPRGRVE